MIRSILIAGGLASALVAAAPPSVSQERPTVTLTGCLRTGSTSSIYLLRGAAAPSTGVGEAPGATATALRFEDLLLVAPSNIDLAPHVNHRIAVTGVKSEAKDSPPPPQGANTAEKALNRLSVESLKEVASNCS
jgi:hypothetical protein